MDGPLVCWDNFLKTRKLHTSYVCHIWAHSILGQHTIHTLEIECKNCNLCCYARYMSYFCCCFWGCFALKDKVFRVKLNSVIFLFIKERTFRTLRTKNCNLCCYARYMSYFCCCFWGCFALKNKVFRVKCNSYFYSLKKELLEWNFEDQKFSWMQKLQSLLLRKVHELFMLLFLRLFCTER